MQYTRWVNKTVRVDIDTGEQLTELQVKKYYKIVRSLKPKITYTNANKTIGTREFTKLYRNRNQTELQFGDMGKA